LKYKHTNPSWYKQGMDYEIAKKGMGSESVQIVNPPQSRGQPIQQAPIPSQSQSSEPKTLKELGDKYPDPTNEQTSKPPGIEEKKEDDAPKLTTPESDNSGADSPQPTQIKKEDRTKMIETELNNDNQKYLGIAVEKINSLTDEDFKKQLNNLDELITKFRTFKLFLPVQLKGMLLSTSSDELIKFISDSCPEKFKIVQEMKKEDDAIKLLEDIKKELN